MPYNVHFGARRSVVHDSMSDCMWLQLPSSQIEGCFLFLRYHLSLLQTLSLSICQSSCHLANISPVNPNIYPSSGKLHVCSHPLHSPHALSLHHLYIHLFTSSPLTDASQTERCSNIDILSLFVFNIKSDSDHSSLSLPSVHHQSSRCPLQTLVLRGVHISGGGALSLWQADWWYVAMCSKSNRFHYSKESAKVFLFEKFSGFKLHHSGLGSVHRLYK